MAKDYSRVLEDRERKQANFHVALATVVLFLVILLSSYHAI